MKYKYMSRPGPTVWAVVLLVAVLASLSWVPVARAATVTTHLYVRAGTFETVDLLSIPALCYTQSPVGPATLTLPALAVNVGDTLSVMLHNQDVAPHGFEVVGIGGATSTVAAGAVATFEFVFPSAGTWLYRDPVAYPLNVGLGLSGAIEVVDPAATYANEFLWLLDEHCPDWMTAHAAGQVVDTSTYHPTHFTINGVSGGDIGTNARAHIVGRVGQRLLIRVVNGGLRLHSLHFHGYHVQVIARNGASLPAPIAKDTIAVPVGKTADFVLVPHQPGVFPIHDHVVLSVSASGVYPLGMIVFTDIQP